MLTRRVPFPVFRGGGQVVAGAGSVAALRTVTAARICVIASPSVIGHDAAAAAVSRAVGHTAHLVLDGLAGEPVFDDLADPAGEVSAFRPDLIVAVGGGSTIDRAKLLWAMYEHPDLDLRRVRAFALPPMRGLARLVAVPTTAGSGSEVSSTAVFTDGGTKCFLTSHELLPDLVLLDPVLAALAPALVHAAAAMDALAHAVEGYASKAANAVTEPMAVAAAQELLSLLPTLLQDPGDHPTMLRMQNAALLAGWVQNHCTPGIGHALAHQMGEFGLSHGAACGVLLPHAVRVNCGVPEIGTRYNALAQRLGMRNAEELADGCRDLLERSQLPMGLSAAACTSDIWAGRDAIVEQAMADPCARSNPRPVDRELLLEVLSAAR